MQTAYEVEPYTYSVGLRKCGDCAALPGYEHSFGCDVARCPLCGVQRLQCDEHARSKSPAIWNGVWPGEVECVEYNLWTKWVDSYGNVIPFGDWETRGHWQQTTVDDPDRSPGLNELMQMVMSGQLIWSRRLQRFVKRDFDDKEKLKKAGFK